MNTYPITDHDELARQLLAANREGALAAFCEIHRDDFTIQTLEALGRVMNQWRLKDANSTMELARIGNEVAAKIGTDNAFGFADWLLGAAFSYAN